MPMQAPGSSAQQCTACAALRTGNARSACFAHLIKAKEVAPAATATARLLQEQETIPVGYDLEACLQAP